MIVHKFPISAKGAQNGVWHTAGVQQGIARGIWCVVMGEWVGSGV
jgi:hypothetical protein